MKHSTSITIRSCCLVELIKKSISVWDDNHEKDLAGIGLQNGGQGVLPHLGPVSIKSIYNLLWRKSGSDTCIESLRDGFVHLLNINLQEQYLQLANFSYD